MMPLRRQMATLDEEREAYREKLRNEVARRLKEQRL